MPYDDDDVGGVDLGARFFGPRPVHEQSQEPRIPGDDVSALNKRLAGVDEDFPLGNEPDALTEKEKARAATVVDLITQMFRNTALTVANPAHIQPTVFSNPIDVSNRISLPAAASPNWTTLVSFTVQPGRWARINGYGINVRDAAYTYNGDILFRMIVDDTPQQTLEGFAEQRGTPVDPREVNVIVRQRERVQLQCRRAVAGAGAVDIDAVLVGWTWRLRNTYEGTQASVTAY